MRGLFVFFLGIISALILTGCGPSMTQLKTDNAGVHTFERDIRYTEAYNMTRDWAMSKYTCKKSKNKDLGPFGWGVTSSIYPEVKFGQVGVEFHDIFSGQAYYLNIQIDSKGNNKTKIQTYYRFKSWEEDARDLEKYFNEKMTTTQ